MDQRVIMEGAGFFDAACSIDLPLHDSTGRDVRHATPFLYRAAVMTPADCCSSAALQPRLLF